MARTSRRRSDAGAARFVERKNAGDLDAIFAELAVTGASVYGLTGADIEPGLRAFFRKHTNLQHQFIGEPIVPFDDENVVQYHFTKTWLDDDGTVVEWRSLDPAKPRDKVERLHFDSTQTRLISVDVVPADAPFDATVV